MLLFPYYLFFFSQGMENIETLSLELSRSKEMWFTKEVFASMKKLRLLKVYYNDDVMGKE